HGLLVFFQKRFVLLKIHFPVHRFLLTPILRNPHFLPETGKLRKPAFHHFECAIARADAVHGTQIRCSAWHYAVHGIR
ncbi:MAG: hypothetical protein ACI4SU_05390, partial [Anaerovoracaceae bacterium]